MLMDYVCTVAHSVRLQDQSRAVPRNGERTQLAIIVVICDRIAYLYNDILTIYFRLYRTIRHVNRRNQDKFSYIWDLFDIEYV